MGNGTDNEPRCSRCRRTVAILHCEQDGMLCTQSTKGDILKLRQAMETSSPDVRRELFALEIKECRS